MRGKLLRIAGLPVSECDRQTERQTRNCTSAVITNPLYSIEELLIYHLFSRHHGAFQSKYSHKNKISNPFIECHDRRPMLNQQHLWQ